MRRGQRHGSTASAAASAFDHPILGAALESDVSKLAEAPEQFVAPSTDLSRLLLAATKQLFDVAKRTESQTGCAGPLPELIVENLDNEQIWEEISLQNDALLKYADPVVARLQKIAKQAAEKEASEESEDASNESRNVEDGLDEEVEEREADEGADDEEDEEDEDGEGFFNADEAQGDAAEVGDSDSEDALLDAALDRATSVDSKKSASGKKKGSVVDSGFFKLEDMERFADDAEEEEERRRATLEASEDDEDDADSDGGDDDGSAAANIRYADFFGPVRSKNIDDVERAPGEEQGDSFDGLRESASEDESDGLDGVANGADKSHEEDPAHKSDLLSGDESSVNTPKSRYERERAALSRRIAELEEVNISQKPWQLLGEVTAMKRPVGSLLELDVDHERAGKLPPVVTPEITTSIEDMIRRRVLDQSFDDPIRKLLSEERKWKPPAKLSDEKSKHSLSEIYESEYLQQQTGAEKPDQLTEQHEEISVLFKKLCYKLDALANFHYTPKPIVPELSIKPNVPAIRMEEVTPLAVSKADVHAPEEIYAKPSLKRMKGDTEITQEDRKRARKEKKEKHKKQAQKKLSQKKVHAALHPNAQKPADSTQEVIKKISKDKRVTVATPAHGPKSNTRSKQFFARMQENASASTGGNSKTDGFATQSSFLKM